MTSTTPRALRIAIPGVLLAAVAALLVVRGSEDGSSASTHAPDGLATGAGTGIDPDAGSPVTIGEQPIAPGAYRYRMEQRQPGVAPQVHESTAVVSATAEERDYFGTRIRREYSWQGDERVESAMTLLRGDYRGLCRWQPGLVTLKRPVTTGAAWTTEASCTLAVVNGKVAMSVHEDARIAEVTAVAVRIERTIRTTSTSNGRTAERRTQRTEWLSPRDGLLLRAVERSTETGDGPSQTFELIEELLGQGTG